MYDNNNKCDIIIGNNTITKEIFVLIRTVVKHILINYNLKK